MNQQLSSIIQQVQNIQINHNVKDKTKNTQTNKTTNRLKESVLSGLKNAERGMELMLLKNILLPDPNVLHYNCMMVKQDLCRILQAMHPIRIDLFGSTVMGIAFQGENNSIFQQMFHIYLNTFLFLPSGSDFDFYIQLLEPIQDTSKLLYRVMHQLDLSKRFTDFEVVTGARIPILKCVHAVTRFPCDLNFTNNIGVYNSAIMARLLSFDGRIYVLAMLIKCWLKVHNLIGSNCITSYSALWLLMFYLQGMKQPILPPIEVFQRGLPPCYVQSANIAFNFQMPNFFYNNKGPMELFCGFFEFYAKFDFESHIICPYLGRAMLRKNFAQNRHLFYMNPFVLSMRLDKSICIQDPFELCHTIPGKVSKNYFHTFRMAIGNAANICRQKMNNFNDKDLLLSLFNGNDGQTINLVECELLNGKTMQKSCKIGPIENELEKVAEFLHGVHADDCNRQDNKEIISTWALLCIGFIIDIFKRTFKCLITTTTEDNILFKMVDIFDITDSDASISDSSDARPINIFCKISAIDKNCNIISIDLTDLSEESASHAFEKFYSESICQIRSLIAEYFAKMTATLLPIKSDKIVSALKDRNVPEKMVCLVLQTPVNRPSVPNIVTASGVLSRRIRPLQREMI